MNQMRFDVTLHNSLSYTDKNLQLFARGKLIEKLGFISNDKNRHNKSVVFIVF